MLSALRVVIQFAPLSSYLRGFRRYRSYRIDLIWYTTWHISNSINLKRTLLYNPAEWWRSGLLFEIVQLTDLLCPVELFQLHFSSFKAGIANAIFSFKWRKIFVFVENIFDYNWASTTYFIINFSGIIIWLKICIYKGLAGQGLSMFFSLLYIIQKWWLCKVWFVKIRKKMLWAIIISQYVTYSNFPNVNLFIIIHNYYVYHFGLLFSQVQIIYPHEIWMRWT